MTWTSPMTFVANQVLTAAQVNTFLRDNMLESEMAKATTANGYFIGNATNSIVQRIPQYAEENGTGTTQSTDFTDLTTANDGPSVTCTTGTQALVFFSAQMWADTSEAQIRMNYDISGDTTRQPADETGLTIDGLTGTSQVVQMGQYDVAQNLNPGTNVFTLKYAASRSSPATCSFSGRRLLVLPL